jgi:hypothetical protein
VIRENRAVRKSRVHLVIVALVAALTVLAVVPAFASALIVVDSPGDQAGAARCEAPLTPGECTLRAAIEAANASPGFDPVEFSIAVFQGRVGTDEIEPATPLPAITQPMTLFGHPVFGTYQSPTVGVTAPSGAAGLKVESPGVSIEDLAFGGGKTGIEVAFGSTGFKARSDWFGLKLDGTANAITDVGLALGPGADGATIGEGTESTRNVFTHAELGIRVEGASQATILGNYIGVGPTGAAAGLENGVRIFDVPAWEAKGNAIGGERTSAVGTTECGGACNVIATESGEAIDLAGSPSQPRIAATGPTTILGNFIGLGPDGVTPVGENDVGVLAAPSVGGCTGGPGDVTVGGPAAAEANFIAGGIEAIFAEAAEGFAAIGNVIGLGPDGSETRLPEAVAIGLCNGSVTNGPLVESNVMSLGPDTFGIETTDGKATIVGNSIQGSYVGIVARESGGALGNLIEGNTITEPDVNGIEILSDSNVVTGNTITKAGRYAILIDDTEHNRIGGDGVGEANTIVESGTFQFEEGGAIVIFGVEASRNEIAANTGFGNFGAFIELVGHGSEETPNGLKPPTVGTALQSVAIGSAESEVTVRVFSKASAEAGELGALLAVVKADAAGNWKATYAKQPVGTLIAATQTSKAGTPEAGTSEISAPVAATADPEEEKGGGGGGTGGGSSGTGSSSPTPTPAPPVPPAVKPKVKIASGPKKTSTSTTAKLKFKATNVKGAKFECKLDGAKWAKCSSPKIYKRLKVGKHAFRVRAVASGLTGAVTKYQFSVKS